MDAISLGKAISRGMDAMGFTSQREVANLAKVSRQYFCDLVSGCVRLTHKPTDIGVGVLCRIADVLQMPRISLIESAGYDLVNNYKGYGLILVEDGDFWVLRVSKKKLPQADFFRLQRLVDLMVDGSVARSKSAAAPTVPAELVDLYNKALEVMQGTQDRQAVMALLADSFPDIEKIAVKSAH